MHVRPGNGPEAGASSSTPMSKMVGRLRALSARDLRSETPKCPQMPGVGARGSAGTGHWGGGQLTFSQPPARSPGLGPQKLVNQVTCPTQSPPPPLVATGRHASLAVSEGVIAAASGAAGLHQGDCNGGCKTGTQRHRLSASEAASEATRLPVSETASLAGRGWRTWDCKGPSGSGCGCGCE